MRSRTAHAIKAVTLAVGNKLIANISQNNVYKCFGGPLRVLSREVVVFYIKEQLVDVQEHLR